MEGEVCRKYAIMAERLVFVYRFYVFLINMAEKLCEEQRSRKKSPDLITSFHYIEFMTVWFTIKNIKI